MDLLYGEIVMIPVVFLHLKSANSVNKKVIEQAEKGNKVFLIGDNYTRGLVTSPDESFVDINQVIDDDFMEFTRLYDHLSTNPKNVELFCFVRWFAIKKFMEVFEYDRIFYADTDVMVYCDVTEEEKKYEQFDMTLIHRCCGSTSFISKTAINDFCSFMLDIYRDKEGHSYGELLNKFSNMQKHNKDGGVCDMTLLEMFHYADSAGGGPCKVGEMTHVIDNSTFDHNINVDDGGVYDHNGHHKNIIFEDGIPYCFHKKLDRLVKFNALHYQGPAKQLLL